MQNQHHQNLILFGYKGCGKTYFGKILARELEKHFIDTDLMIEELYKKEFQDEANCREISLKVGNNLFRELEGKVIDSLQNVSDSIIATGGGILLNPINCLKLKQLGLLVYLEVTKETIKERIFKSGIPAFLDPDEPEKSFEKMIEERKTLYEKISLYTVKLNGKTNEQILTRLKKIWEDDKPDPVGYAIAQRAIIHLGTLSPEFSSDIL